MREKGPKIYKTRTKRTWLSLIFVVSIFIISAVLMSGCVERGQNAPISEVTAAPGKTERVVFAIDGMYCTNCAAGIKAMLKRTSGVSSAEASFERKEAVVEYDPAVTSREKIIEAINDMGYQASVKG